MITKMKKYDEINPSHYVGKTGMPAIGVLELYGLTAHLFTALKYVFRAGKKPGVSPVKDMEKALWFVNRAIGENHIIRTLNFTELEPCMFVSQEAPSAVEIIEEFEVSPRLKSGVLSLFGFIAHHGEVSDAVLHHLKRGIEEELKELKAYKLTFGYDRRKDSAVASGQPEAQQESAVAGGDLYASDAHQHPQGSAKERAAS